MYSHLPVSLQLGHGDACHEHSRTRPSSFEVSFEHTRSSPGEKFVTTPEFHNCYIEKS